VEDSLILNSPQLDAAWKTVWPAGVALIDIRKARFYSPPTSAPDNAATQEFYQIPERHERRYASSAALIQGSGINLTEIGKRDKASVFIVGSHYGDNVIDFWVISKSGDPEEALPTIRAVDAVLTKLRHQ
jgi:hypothetical protein